MSRARVIISVCMIGFAALLVWLTWDDEPAGSPIAAGTELPGSGSALAVEQGWSAHTLERSWYTSFGSRLLPRDWFIALERADSEDPFRNDEHLAKFGFLSQAPNDFNPDGFPVGLAVSDTEPASYVGLTCAACHTGELRYGGKRLRIAGGAGMIDIAGFEDSLLRALQATASNETKFKRLATRVGSSPGLREELAGSIERLARRTRINRVDVPYGHGRMDAFGQIFNAVSAEFLGQPDNFSAPDAPVSIPSLWNTPRMDRVQWNGSSPNTSVAPLVQNVTTALAVYGDADLIHPGTLGYRSTVNFSALGHLQHWNKLLRSPAWPETWFGALDSAAVARGRDLYSANCLRCHAIADRTNAEQMIPTTLVALAEIGTDPRMADNFVDRRVKSGALSGRRSLLWGGTPFGEETRAIDLVVHAALGATAQHPLLALRAVFAGHASASAAGESTTRAYKAGPLAGIWATAPYLHNGSVPTLYDLLLTPEQRPVEFSVGDYEFDPNKVGLAAMCARGSRFDTRLSGNHNSGHMYGTALEPTQKADLLEFLKSL
jgi:hypothetical protein